MAQEHVTVILMFSERPWSDKGR